MKTDNNIERVGQIYKSTLSSLDNVLIGQKNVKKAVATSILCDTSSKILLTGNTGAGKTTLSNYLASGFNSQRISVTSDMIPSDVQDQLKEKKEMRFLQVDEFNRASGKVQSVFIELFAEKQISVGGIKHKFNDFYVFATQNSADISGIYNVPQAVYDRFDVNIYFENLTDEEKRRLLFTEFEPATKSNITEKDLLITKTTVDGFKTEKRDEDLMMQTFELIDNMTINGKKLFAGSNIRAHRFALKLAKLAALSSGRDYILPADIVDFINYLYMHRIDQNVAKIGDENVYNKFYDVQNQVMTLNKLVLKRKK